MARPEMWNTLPPFYREPVILCADTHRNKALLPRQDFGFVADNTAIPLGVAEFPLAIRHYPIVFAPGNLPVPLAVTGLLTGGNLFVGHGDSGWRVNTYIPGYLRRYPFILGQEVEGGTAPLILDMASLLVVEAGMDDQAIRLFEEDGSPTRLTEDAISLCVSAHREQVGTVAFAQALRDAGILVRGNARIAMPDGSTQTVQGFATVDERAYRALPDKLLTRWHALGWLDAVVLHLASHQNWSLLANLHMERRTMPLT